MEFNFDTLVNRRGTNSLKWDTTAENELPMWVADMDFAAAPCIAETIAKRLENGVFGYSVIPDDWYYAYMGWWRKRHGFEMRKDRLAFCSGVIPAISSAVRAYTVPAENVLVLTPVYNIFFNSIVNNGRNVIECPLEKMWGEYKINFSDLERKLADPQTTMMILCNPHNPSGKVWDMDTLEKIGLLCQKYGVVVVSDEIHCDLTNPGISYIPFASVSSVCRDISITCLSPTKSFNIAGLQTAAVYAANEKLFNRINRALNTDEIAEPNCFAVDATIAAYTQGGQWLDALRNYIYGNKTEVVSFIGRNIPSLSVAVNDSTYLLWIDVSRFGMRSDVFSDSVRKNCGLYLSAGTQYRGDGSDYVRMNVACPRSVLKDGLTRLLKAVDN